MSAHQRRGSAVVAGVAAAVSVLAISISRLQSLKWSLFINQLIDIGDDTSQHVKCQSPD